MKILSTIKCTGQRCCLVAVLALWFIVALVLGCLGTFAPDPMHPPWALMTALAGPPLLFVVLYAYSMRFRQVMLNIDLRFITAMQAWRVLGGMFLVLYGYGLLPGAFAWPAGVGDLLVGAAAPFVVIAIINQAKYLQQQVIALNVVGLLDFAGAITMGLLTGQSAVGLLANPMNSDILLELPLSLIPTFGVPFWIILHFISLLQIWNKNNPAPSP